MSELLPHFHLARSLSLPVALAVCLFGWQVSLIAGTGGDVVSMQTEAIRVCFDRSRNGAIVSLVDMASGYEFVTPRAAPLLYELQFGTGAPRPITLTEGNAETMTISEEGQSVVVRTSHTDELALEVECTFRTEVGSPLIFARIRVRHESDMGLLQIRFPALACPSQLGASADDDVLVYPYCDGCLVETPGKVGWIPSLSYPGTASMQFMALHDQTAGLYLATYDAQGHTKRFAAENCGGVFRPAIWHLPPSAPRAEWRMSYDVVLGTFRGDWQAAAHIYKTWAIKQP